ncbi:MAG: DUF305 domain-containing protein [Actinobacteria bacterium]|nr:DUF305 domain-containing protein [Actinomycetota bacterium]
MKRIAIALTVLTLLTGCARINTANSPNNHMSQMPGTNTSANASDIMFVQMMIPHHSQAIEMSDYAKTNTTNPVVLALAAKISAAQQPEIDLMGNWLHQWGIHDMHEMDMNMSDDGMLSDSQMATLKAATGKEFDKLYLTGMIAHHQGAVAMAQEVLVDGQNSRVHELATNIVESQTSEIAQMQEMVAAVS